MTKQDYIEFQARTTPLAYLITFRTYGTWLHGDERGSMDRRYHNRVGSPKIAKSHGLLQHEQELLKHPPVIFNPAQRQAVEAAITEVCTVRGYGLRAINVRTNHVHVVVETANKPEPVMRSFKSYATRKLREVGLMAVGIEPWSRHGSTLYLWTEEEVESAVQYVLFGQERERYERPGKPVANESPM